MRLLIAVTVGAALAAATPAPAQTSSGPPIAGVIKSFDGKTLSLTGNDGQTSTVVLAPATRIFVSVPRTLADIKPGDFIASAGTRGADGVLRANEIRIFSAPAGEGQFPMTKPGQTMTNATVKQVITGATVKEISGGGTTVIRLTFRGAGPPGSPNCTGRAADSPGGPGTGCVGETEFEVPANVPVVAQMPAKPSVLTTGVKANVVIAPASDPPTATRIIVSR
jgi:endonuclease YncB( thermonuclease family)